MTIEEMMTEEIMKEEMTTEDNPKEEKLTFASSGIEETVNLVINATMLMRSPLDAFSRRDVTKKKSADFSMMTC